MIIYLFPKSPAHQLATKSTALPTTSLIYLKHWQDYLDNVSLSTPAESLAHSDKFTGELQALENQNFLVELSHYGCLKVSGEKAQDFLQGLVSCDMKTINPDHSSLAAYCNQKGRVLGIFRIFQWGEDYYLRMPRVLIPAIETSLMKFAVLSNIELTDVSESISAFGIVGEKTLQILNESTNSPSSASFQRTLESIYQRTQKQTSKIESTVISNDNILISQVPGTPTRYEIYGATNNIIDLFETLQQHSPPTKHTLWHYLDIQAGIPNIYPDTQKLFTPHMLNLPELGAVSFEKGCYRGQEIVARTHFLGKSKQQMYRATIQSQALPSLGSEIMTNDPQSAKSCGNIVDCCHKNSDEIVILAVIHKQFVEANHLYIGSIDGPILTIES